MAERMNFRISSTESIQWHFNRHPELGEEIILGDRGVFRVGGRLPADGPELEYEAEWLREPTSAELAAIAPAESAFTLPQPRPEPRWQIIDGPNPLDDGRGLEIDGDLYVAIIQDLSDRSRPQIFCRIAVSRSAQQSDPETLPLDVRQALAGNWDAALAAFFSSRDFPEFIDVTTTGVRPPNHS